MSPRRVLVSALTLLLAPAFVTVAAVPAHAAGGSTKAGNGVTYQCYQHSYEYSVDLPEDTESWSMDVSVEGPDGLEATSDFLYEVPASGRSSFQVCSFDMPGTYTIRASVEAYDSSWEETTFELAPSTFTLRKPRTKTTIKASTTRPRKGQVVRFTVVSKDERPRGYFAHAYADVVLQTFKAGRWVNVKGTKTYTGSTGRAVIKTRFAGSKVRMRARTLADDDTTGSQSAAVTLRR
ncbi:hypothetical protein GGQ22_18260 [Nocardioides sp. zg-579]|uniref:Uncharacterized protein n=1 Tax=Nocardioides marmotae TaxID=2663857 RepID=A0A6I3JG07_9ACTN|nr:hypothetical protein [Nocardioides marmotae]MCR6033363.1 hypothetical protein [Gordonia jinghuaiqii]MTB97020.1 hypothetical protein [Nocardioides marmotae]QKE00601.1 hypothetical protein HPC71_05540 [Nocardioides marmotae]